MTFYLRIELQKWWALKLSWNRKGEEEEETIMILKQAPEAGTERQTKLNGIQTRGVRVGGVSGSCKFMNIYWGSRQKRRSGAVRSVVCTGPQAGPRPGRVRRRERVAPGVRHGGRGAGSRSIPAPRAPPVTPPPPPPAPVLPAPPSPSPRWRRARRR